MSGKGRKARLTASEIYQRDCTTKALRKTPNCKKLRKQMDIDLREAARKSHRVTPPARAALPEVADFLDRPFTFYRDMLRKFTEGIVYPQISDGQRYSAIVIEILKPEPGVDLVTIFGNNPLFNDDLDTYKGTSPTFFRVFIPDLDKTIPIPTSITDPAIKAFLSSKDRMAFYVGKKGIVLGQMVQVSGLDSATKEFKLLEIVDVISDGPIVRIPEKEDDAYQTLKECLSDFSLKFPQSTPKPTPEPSVPPPVTTTNLQAIYSSKELAPPEIVHPREFTFNPANPLNPPREKTEEEKKIDIIRELQLELKAVTKCNDIEITSISTPTVTDQVVEKPKDNYITKDGIPKINCAKVVHAYDNISSYVEASDDQNSATLSLSLPPETREPSLIVIKEAPFLEFKEYFDSIKSQNSYAAHFCIDYDGKIYQLADTNNIIKSYNPTIYESSIQIAVLNISYRNSEQTLKVINRKNNSLEFLTELFLKCLSDKIRLSGFYKRKKNLNKKEITYRGLPRKALIGKSLRDKWYYSKIFIWDKEPFPDYRLDIEQAQKDSLKQLVSALCTEYGINKSFPQGITVTGVKFPTLEPEIMSGEFSGICCPYNFLQSSDNGIFFLEEIIGN